MIDARLNRTEPPKWLHLQALSPNKVLGAFGKRPPMLVAWFDPSLTTDIDAFALGDLFDMTPTEAQVAALLAKGITAQASARS